VGSEVTRYGGLTQGDFISEIAANAAFFPQQLLQDGDPGRVAERLEGRGEALLQIGVGFRFCSTHGVVV